MIAAQSCQNKKHYAPPPAGLAFTPVVALTLAIGDDYHYDPDC
jgi:hypothetical protein